MFIVSKKNFDFRFPDGTVYRVARDFMGNVPTYVREHPLFQMAVKGGDILVPDTTADKAIYQADEKAAETAQSLDIRPDAKKVKSDAPKAAKAVRKASRSLKK